MEDWPEIETCKSENRRELTIKDCPSKFDKFDGAAPKELYTLPLINFLEISGCEVKTLSNEISSLNALANLILTRNKLQELPSSICELQSLKVLDVSYNSISSLPTDFGRLTNLQTLNLNSNKLCELPETVASLTLLSSIDVSNNNFTKIPEVLLEGKHTHLAEVKASHNEIEDCGDGIGKLQALKTLDLSSNKLKELPQAIANCLKLKHADYKDNPLKDRRLKKLIEQNNSSQKAIMDYIRTKGRPASDSAGSVPSGGGKGKRKKKGGGAKQEVDEDLIKHFIQILKFETASAGNDEAETLEVIVSDEVKDVRPYIVCCIVKRLDLSKESTLKKFLAIQTKLHEDVCGKRTIGTIASHDVPSLQNSKLHYDAKEPGTFKVHPLGRNEEVTALQMYKQLKAEADELRKEKKRSNVSGIYKYLSLLESQEKFAFLSRSSDNVVVSLPPLTNSDVSKIKIGKNDVLLEVTSSQNLGSCKTIMDKLLKAMVDEGMCSAKESDFYSDSSDEEVVAKAPVSSTNRLIVQQTRILDSNGKMKVVYPSRTDLEYGDSTIKIERPH